MSRTMRFTMAGAAVLIAVVCVLGWVLQVKRGVGLGGQLLYAAGAGFMVGLAIWALRQDAPPR